MAKGLRILPILLGGRPLPILERFVYFDATSGELPSEKVTEREPGFAVETLLRVSPTLRRP